MALKDLLVYVDRTDAALVRLRLAVDLACRHASQLTALYVRQSSPAQLHERKMAELGLIPAEELDRLDRRIEASIDGAAERLRSALEVFERERGLKTEWCCVDGLPSVAVPQHARYADLSILGHGAPADGDSGEYTFSEQILFVTGRPVLFIPVFGSFETLGRHIVVAWNSSRAAARAVNDALPLIERAERTTVLTVNPADFIDRHDALPAERMVEHLRRHGASADAIRLEKVPGGSIADALQAKAHALGADLIVAGAFGHPRLWEKLLGGVTRDLLARMSLPILMSH
ncbi:MAG: universal stress protein [Methylocella sp.]